MSHCHYHKQRSKTQELKTRKMKRILYLLGGFMVTLTGCVHNYTISPGPLTEELRTEPPFHSIILEGSMDVFITQDTTYNIKVEAGEKVIDYIKTDVENGELVIRETSNNIFNDKPIRVYVSVDSLEQIEINGSGNISASQVYGQLMKLDINGSGDMDMDVQAHSIDLEIRGSGNVELLGNVDLLDIEVEGSGDVYSRYLYSNDCFIEIDGSGDATIHATDNLDIEIDGSGDVYYYGNPTNVSTTINGSGDVYQMN